MSNIAIHVDNLSKKYRLGLTHSTTLRHALSHFGQTILRRARQPISDKATHSHPQSFWALRDISFEVRQGEVLGIIGRNGAGKSTLLKILSRITHPTTGRANIYGRVGSLLEVGTGFHPELTGRENIYLNGAILGMTRHEITRRFDDIVSFAQLEDFIDTPVKRYSSGMHVRLGFAVAAHLDTEIIIVDEVLAVGDATFQRRCLGKMNDVARGGRTVLLVSHNMGAIHQLCPRSLWIDKGHLRYIGNTSRVISAYLQEAIPTLQKAEPTFFDDDPAKEVQLRSIDILSDDRRSSRCFNCDSRILIAITLRVRTKTPGLYGYLEIRRLDGTTVLMSDSFDVPPNELDNLPIGDHTIHLTIPPRTLAPSDYHVFLSFASPSAHNFFTDRPGIVAQFRLDDYTTRRGNDRPGFLSTLLSWRLARASND